MSVVRGSPNPAYKMAGNPVHGIALIISNRTFDQGTGLPYRAGGEVDEVNVQELFGSKYLNYKVVFLKNLKGGQIDMALRLVSGHKGFSYMHLSKNDKKALEALSSADNLIAASHDSFVCCIMSQGANGVVHGTDKEKFDLQNIYHYLGECGHLKKKPKMVFIQAGQGSEFADHKTADFLLSYAAFNGQRSFREIEKGSWYLSALCNTFKENYKSKDVVSMITDVHKEVMKQEAEDARGRVCLECPRLEHTLRHKVHLAVEGGWFVVRGSSNPAYKMAGNPVHGIALIISNLKFDQGTAGSLQYRLGGEVDQVNSQELFGSKYLNYKVVFLKNLKGGQIDMALRLVSGHEGFSYMQLDEGDKKALEALSSADSLIAAGHDSFVCCLMSHGGLGKVYGTDKETFDLENIYHYLGECGHLKKKPKMVFIQAGQGSEFADHKTADFLLSYAAFNGQRSFREIEKGSWYMNALCNTFKENYKSKDVVSMITDVHKEVMKQEAKDAEGKVCLQCPRLEHTLRHKAHLAKEGGWLSWLRQSNTTVTAQVVDNGNNIQSMAEQQYEEAMKQGSVKMSITKCLVLGIAGVGKTHLKRLILQEGNLPHVGQTHLKRLILQDESLPRVSTGLADNPVQAFVGSMDSILAEVDEKDYGKWEVMDEDKLLQVLASAYQVEPSDQQQSGAPISSEPSVTEQAEVEHTDQMTSKVTSDEHTDHATSKVTSDDHTDHATSKVTSDELIDHTISKVTSDEHTDQAASEVMRRFFEIFKNMPLITDKKTFNLKLVQFIDSGGQPQFHELLPAFVQNVSAIVFCINLSEKLDNHPMIYFYGPDGKPVGDPYESTYSHRQVLEQCVRVADSRDVHSNYKVFVVGTHKDKEMECDEKRDIKDELVSKIVGSKSLIAKSWNEDIIWAVNCKCPGSPDKDVADMLRREVISKCLNDPYSLPIKWFVLEMQIMKSASHGVLKYDKCLQLAKRLGMDEQGLKAAIFHMVKYNLLLWYDVDGLQDVVFTDPQVILKIITELVQCKYELNRHNLPPMLGNNSVTLADRIMFKDHATVSRGFLSQDPFKKHFVDGIFTVEHFIQLMCHLFIMVPLKYDEYLMPALLDPLSSDKICRENKRVDVEPLLVCFPNGCVPYGIFSCLIAFLQKEHCKLVENNKVPICLHRNCVAFKLIPFPAKFTIIDSMTYIEVHLGEGDEEDTGKACTRIKKIIYDGIKECAKVLHYNSLDLTDGFICSTESCKHVARPYVEDLHKAQCTGSTAHDDTLLTRKHTVWIEEIQSTSLDPFIPSSQSATEPTSVLKNTPHPMPQPQTVPQTQFLQPPPPPPSPQRPGLQGPPSLPLLMSFPTRGGNINIIQRIGNNYSTFGIFLLNDDNGITVDTLKYEHHFNAEAITTAIFRTWLQGTGRRPITWGTLVATLRYVDLHALADQIEGVSQPQPVLQPQPEQPVLPVYKGMKMQLIAAALICLISIIIIYDNLKLSTLWWASSLFWIFFSTSAGSPSSATVLAGGMGCCPVIVGSSIIEPLSGYRGNVNIIVDFGTCPKTPDGGFKWHVSWGDGDSSDKPSDALGPFQITHQYKQAGTYAVTVKYCSSPPNGQPCCLDLHRQISVAS